MTTKLAKYSRALVLAAALAPLPALADTVNTDVAAEHTATKAPATAPAAATKDDAANYAHRQQKDQAVQKFEGGDAVVFVSGGAVLVALIILLLIL